MGLSPLGPVGMVSVVGGGGGGGGGCPVLVQEYSGTLSSQQMLPLLILQPSPSPSPQRSPSAAWSWEEVYTGQIPALEATCPLGEWQEHTLTTVGMLGGEIPPGGATSLAFPSPKSWRVPKPCPGTLTHPSQSFTPPAPMCVCVCITYVFMCVCEHVYVHRPDVDPECLT